MSSQPVPIVIGSDHAAFPLKEIIKAHVRDLGITVQDVGTDSEASCNYPDFGMRVAALVSAGKFQRGILMCGTGLGMSMGANKFPRVRAALCNNIFSAMMSRRHNDANILVMGGRVIGDVLAKEIVDTWLEEPFEGGRHQQRIDQFNEFDAEAFVKEV
jgi:ribose 5-phosphate isomerase B